MSYWINHLMGDVQVEAPLEKLPELYDELHSADGEHTDVSLTHESEWGLSAFRSGKLVWENVAGEEQPKHMINVPKDKTLKLWQKLAFGKVEEIDNENWQAGYG